MSKIPIDNSTKLYEHNKEDLLAWAATRGSGLVRSKYFQQMAEGYAELMLHATHNSAAALILLHRLVDGRLREIDVKVFFDLFQKHIHSSEFSFQAALQTLTPDDVVHSVEGGEEDYLCASFFEYYWARLGKVLRMNSSARFQNHEIAVLERLSWLLFESKHPLIDRVYKWRGEKRRLDFLSRWSIFHRLFIKALYEKSWVCGAMERSKALSGYPFNIRILAAFLIREYFPLFWDSFEGSHRLGMLLFSSMGYLSGGRDLDELNGDK